MVEVILVILLLSILAVGATYVISDTMNEERFILTQHRLLDIRKALVGDPSLMAAGARSSFGYQGDMGAIPVDTADGGPGLAALWTNPGATTWALNSTSMFGLGWDGPYLNDATAGEDYTTDGWGNAFVYSSVSTPPTVTSYGSDGAAGGTGYAQDIIMELPANVLTATVYGVIVENGAVWNATAEIDLYEPATTGAGTLATTCSPAICPPTTTTSSQNGAFSFTGVPLGIRSVMIYVPNKTSPTQTLGPVVFTVTSNNYLIPATRLDLANAH